MTAVDSKTRLGQAAPSFADQFEVEATGQPGRYRALIGDQWGAPIFPNGGIVSTVALRAMEFELGIPEHTLRTMTTMFASKVVSGEVEIEVEPIRRGKRMSQLRASIRNVGDPEPGHLLTAAFGEARAGVDIPYADLGDVPDPEECEVTPLPPDGEPAFRAGFFQELDARRIKSFNRWEADWEGGVAEATRWARFRNWEGATDVYGLVPLSDTMPSAIGQYLGPGGPLFHSPSVDLTHHAISTPKTDWILCRSRTRWGGRWICVWGDASLRRPSPFRGIRDAAHADALSRRERIRLKSCRSCWMGRSPSGDAMPVVLGPAE